MRPVSLVNPYSEKENQITNYLGVILKYVYKENPELFQTAIFELYDNSKVTDENSKEFEFVPKFQQQKKVGDSIPDLTISQPSFCINFEVKTTDWFYEDQIDRHIENMVNEMLQNQANIKVLFLATSEFKEDIKKRLNHSIESAHEKKVHVALITFSEYIQLLRNLVNEQLPHNHIVNDMLNDLEEHISKEGLMPSLNNCMDIVMTGNTIEEVSNGIYACPNDGGAHSHRKCKFFGAYWGKEVHLVANIDAVVTLSQNGDDDHIEWKNCNDIDDTLILGRAHERIAKCEEERKKSITSDRWLVFVLGDSKEVSYKKKSAGGVRQKRYLPVNSNSLDELVEEIDGKYWE